MKRIVHPSLICVKGDKNEYIDLLLAPIEQALQPEIIIYQTATNYFNNCDRVTDCIRKLCRLKGFSCSDKILKDKTVPSEITTCKDMNDDGIPDLYLRLVKKCSLFEVSGLVMLDPVMTCKAIAEAPSLVVSNSVEIDDEDIVQSEVISNKIIKIDKYLMSESNDSFTDPWDDDIVQFVFTTALKLVNNRRKLSNLFLLVYIQLLVRHEEVLM